MQAVAGAHVGFFFARVCSFLLKLWRLHLQAQLLPLKSALCSCDIWGWREKLPPLPSGRRTFLAKQRAGTSRVSTADLPCSQSPLTLPRLCCVSAGLPWAGALATGDRGQVRGPGKDPSLFMHRACLMKSHWWCFWKSPKSSWSYQK